MLFLVRALTESTLQHLTPDGIGDFAMILRGMVICMMVNEDPEAILSVLQQAMEVVQIAPRVSARLVAAP